MKHHITLTELCSLAGFQGGAMGTPEASVYFDGRQAVVATAVATLAMDCPQAIRTPMLIPAVELLATAGGAPMLKLEEDAEGVLANGRRLTWRPAEGRLPAATRERIALDRAQWKVLVPAFRSEGRHWAQLLAAVPDGDPRPHRNGAYLDFVSGALVAFDGRRLHLVEDALPMQTQPCPEEASPGVIVPGAVVRWLARVGGNQEGFVVQQKAESATDTAERLVCFALGNARLRVRAIGGTRYPNYRDALEANRQQRLGLELEMSAVARLKQVAHLAACNHGTARVELKGQGRQLEIRYDRWATTSVELQDALSLPFSVQVRASDLLEALEAAGTTGLPVCLRHDPAAGRGLYLGSQDFHAIVQAEGIPASSASVTDRETGGGAGPESKAETEMAAG